MARTKQTTRRYRSDGSFYHSDSETPNSDGSIRVPASEISEHPPNPSSDLPLTPTYYSSPSSSGTPSDTILREADSQYQAEPSEQASEEILGEDPAGPSRQSPSSGESSDDDSASSSSDNAFVTSEEARAKISTARESLSVEKGEGWAEPKKAVEKLSATRKPAAVFAAKYRSNVLNRANDEQKTAGTPKSGSTRPSPSKQSQPKIQKTGAGDVSASGKNKKHIAHKPKRGEGSTLETDREVGKPDATQASKGGFKQPSTAVGSTGEKRRHGKEEEVQPDAPVQRPTVVQMAKEMLRALDPEDKASVRGVGTLNLDAILGNLCEAMLRIQGLRRPIQEKSKEVTAAKARAESALDRAQFEIAQNELLTLDMMYSQADANQQVKKDLDSARSKINDLKAEIKGLKEKLEPLQEAKKEAERAKERVGRLEGRLANQEQQRKTKFQSRAEEEKEALVKQMMEDYESIMRMAWEAVQSGADFGIWKSKFDQANEDFNAELLRQAEEEANKADADGEEAGSSSSSSGDEEGDEENAEQPAGEDAAAYVDNSPAP
ncbi:uncharacterized protein LOC110684466 [Chenopodium quinoa]|uniref:uncharacterized protein LOC110684466 n=1 Tax=Chenopodium quinoa TaxID=63459 RepID=UPI000B789E00|nr:uncharacterized protein LOC110684466 [Chenopodium quinoa]